MCSCVDCLRPVCERPLTPSRPPQLTVQAKRAAGEATTAMSAANKKALEASKRAEQVRG